MHSDFRKIGIVCAMRDEMELLQREFPAEGVRCVLSGIGKVNAAVAAERLASDFAPDCILSIGVAGTFVEGLQEGETVIASRTAYHDVWCGKGNSYGQVQDMPVFYEGDPFLVDKALNAIGRNSSPAIRSGLICTGDKFSDDRDVLSNIRTHFPDALAVDMESAAMAQVCHVNGVPFVSFRIISNLSASEESCLQYRRFWEGGAEDRFSILLTYLKNLKNSIQ